MEAILNNLCKIEDLRVVSRNSVEQYRNNPKATIVVAEEMNVSYILEGSGMRHEDQLFVTVQLIDARSDKHIWSESYQKGIGRITELFSRGGTIDRSGDQCTHIPRGKEPDREDPHNQPGGL